MSKLTKMIISLYQELILEILKHLPAKSLIRFRCVSKCWLRIIEDSYFVDYHRARSHTRPGGIQLVSVMDCAFRSCILSDPEGNFQTRLENSLPDAYRISNAEALICFGNHIWNPSTRETMNINIPQVKTCLAISWDNLLGFDAFSNKYKVICFLNCRTQIVNRKNLANRMPLLHVLTLGENCWKQIPFIPEKLRQGFDILSSKSFSNMIFCMIRCGIKLRFEGIKERFGVLTFDVQHEHVGFISFPGMFKFQEADLPIHLADIDGHLAFQTGVELEQTLWVLNHEIAQWTKMEITFAGCSFFNSWYGFVTDGHDNIIANLITLGTIHSNEILFQCDVVTEDYIKGRHLKYLYYDPMTKKIRFVPKLEKNVDGIRDFMMIKYVDSIVRLIPPTQKGREECLDL